MIEWLSDWAGAIIIAVIIGTIIEMILPEGNSKKYIKVVIGIYVLFTIVSPLITKFTGESIKVSDVLDLDKYVEEAKENSKVQNTINNDNQTNIMSIYSSGIKEDMIAKIQTKGYIVNSINVEVANDDSYSINAIEANVTKREEDKEETKNNKNQDIEQIEIVNKIDVHIGENIENNTENKSDNNETENKKNSLSNKEKKELKEYLSSVYEINQDNITIN